MRRKLSLAVVPVIAVCALALLPAWSGATSSPTKIKCKASFVNPTPTKLTGDDFAYPVTCQSPFGKGIQWTHYTETLSKSGVAAAHGPTRAWFDNGSITGSYKASGKLKPGTSTLSGTSEVTSGTGAFRGISGTGTITCKTKDAGAHLACTYVIKLKKL